MNKWDKRFMEMADMVGNWSSCFQENRRMGSIIVINKRIVATGYNGAPVGVKTCVERGECLRRKLDIPSGTQAQTCYAIHAEQNAIVQAARMGHSVEGATIYITHSPCSLCARMIINSGIVRVVYKYSYPDEFTFSLLAEANVLVEEYGKLE